MSLRLKLLEASGLFVRPLASSRASVGLNACFAVAALTARSSAASAAVLRLCWVRGDGRQDEHRMGAWH